MTSQDEVDHFLQEFKYKLGFWGLVLRTDRLKNLQTLADLELTFSDVSRILNKLDVVNYNSGPKEEVLNRGQPMWVFGYKVKSTEVYIKISMGFPGAEVLCISFHDAERPIEYPFKT